MSEPIQEYLVELERELHDFPEERRSVLAAEVVSHLQEQAAELVAVGCGTIEAQREAVRSFGTARSFASRLRAELPAAVRPSPWTLRGTGWAVFGVTAPFFGYALVAPSIYQTGNPALEVVLPACFLLFVVPAFLSRRINVASIVVGMCLTVVLTTLTLAAGFVDLGELDGRDIMAVPSACEITAGGWPHSDVAMPDVQEFSRTADEARAALAVPIPRRALAFLPSTIMPAFLMGTLMIIVMLIRTVIASVLHRVRRRSTRA